MPKLIINILMCFISLVLYYLSPNTYSYEFCFFLFACYLTFNVIYLLEEPKNRSFSFEFLFMIAFLMTNFIYPVFYYLDNPRISLFAFSFNENIISKSTSLALLGYSFYILGNTNYSQKKKEFETINVDNSILGIVLLISIFNFTVFTALGGLEFYKDVYSGGNADSGLTVYFMLFLSVSTYLLAVLMYNCTSKSLKFFSLVYICTLIILFLSTGARLFAMSLALLLLIQYSNLIRKISILIVTLILFFGAFLMHVVQVFRETGVENSSFSEIFIELVNGKSSIFDSFLDLIINNRNLYVLTDFVDSHGYFYFLNISASVFGIFPSIKTFMNFFNIPDFMTTGMLPTYLEFGNNPSFGLGTNMVGEAYLSLGVFGVIIVFYFFGRAINYFSNHSKDNLYFRVVYFFLASQAVFFPRIDYLWGLRLVVWMLITFFLVKIFTNFFKERLK